MVKLKVKERKITKRIRGTHEKTQYIRNKNNERAKNIKQKEGKESQKS